MALHSERILPVMMEDEMRDSYLDYSMSVIVSRALPDIRDGLKPVHRRILYAMYELGMTPNRAYKKSARIVGEVLGKYHPHGDSAVYDAMVRMAQAWSMRYELVDGQGNFGSVDGDSPAAMRYTEARMDSLAMEVLRDIDKNTVDFRSNFDDSLQEPTVLPTVLPTLLVNGANGIAVGMATNIPPHNLREIVNGIKAVIADPNVTNEELLKYITAPDFPTGGIIYGYEGVRSAYTTGRGKIIVRAKANIEANKQGKESIVITELPYQVSKAGLIEKIAALVRAKSLEDISDIRDESDREGIRIVIELKRDGVPMVVLNNLYKHTQMQVTFGAIMLALVNGRPRILTIKEMITEFISHRNEVVVRRTQFDLEAAEKRAHILEGFIIALDNIDAVIATIKASADVPTASAALQTKFELSEIQAKAILDMRLQRLTGLERDKIQAEYRELIETIERLRAILASKELQMSIIGEELTLLAEKHGDERRTAVVHDARDFTLEDMIANEEVIVSITHNGYIKRTPVTTYRRQNKGGRGVAGQGMYDDDYVELVFRASTHHYLMFFTDRGRVYRIKVYDIPEGSRNAKGRSIANVIQKQSDEKVTAYLPVTDIDQENAYVFFATKNGTVKKTALNDYANVRSTGIIAINLADDDRLVGARLTDGHMNILIGASHGLAVHFNETDVRPMGRAAAGVRGIDLPEGAEVISLTAVRHSDAQVIVVGERGYGKRTKVDDFRRTKRGAKGVIAMNITEKTGPICAILEVTDTEDLVVMTVNGILIRQHVEDIRVIGRNTQGVRLIRLEEGDSIAAITTVTRDSEEEDDTESETPVS
ncbi:MAG: DNA gyrase subunit A [Chlorobi bacterium]|nr:MAG: DNA gyrase subunit A [Bacteroidota bacterium]MBE2266090.1 DNA gyrase subunit A [Flavobacteriales bacterium]MBL1160662.1 DNA gyrase subunit A [Chlorobiota bacterium]MBW7853013.1 DNA gyrase subunit A [Candidatus Kapabacteria bacterium]MCC6331498.1 DNA gyrase subunit A [Ignavibacteria bacterium]